MYKHVILGLLCDHSGVTFSLVWHQCGIKMRSCWQVGIAMRSFWHRFAIVLAPFLDTSGIMMDHFGNILGSVWCHLGVISGPF